MREAERVFGALCTVPSEAAGKYISADAQRTLGAISAFFRTA
jgi:hypothetical protein